MPLKRELGLATAIAMVTGESIALGIFLTPAAMAKSLGSPALLLAVWFAMAVMAGAGALCYAQLALAFPYAGGGYIYLRRYYGATAAFLYGWMCLTVMDSGLSGALAVGAVAYLGTLVPALAVAPRVSAAALLIVLAAVNYRGTRIGGRFQATINLLKLAILAVLIGWSFFGPCGGSVRNLLPFAGRRGTSDVLLMAIAGASINAFFSFGGWWDVTKLAGEIRDPRRTLPRAMVLGIAAVTLVYVGLSAAFLYVVPIETVVSNSAFVAQFGEALFGRFGANVLSICVLVSVLGGLAVLMMAAPRVYYAMALDGNFFRWFARLDSRYNTPGRAILLQLGCSLLILGLGAFDKIIAYVIFMAVLFLALTAGATFKLPRETKAGIWYPAAPILFIVCCGLVAAMILLRNPLQALLGCVVVAFGCPAFWLMKKPAKLQRSASSVTTISQQAGASVE